MVADAQPVQETPDHLVQSSQFPVPREVRQLEVQVGHCADAEKCKAKPMSKKKILYKFLMLKIM
jgi:hypothetical protein